MSSAVPSDAGEISDAARGRRGARSSASRSIVATPELHQRLVQCAQQARTVDVRPFELRAVGDARDGLVPPVLRVVDDAIGVCRDVLDAFDAEESATDDLDVAFTEAPADPRNTGVFHVRVDELVERPVAERQVADVAFLGATELRTKRTRIEHVRAKTDPWEIVSECGSALRRVEKSLTAIEVVLCGASQLPRQLSFASQLSRSLEVRQNYARLRQTIASLATSDTPRHRALRLAGTAIAMLIGKDVYPELRIDDRRQLRALQERILAWLRCDAARPENEREADRILQDLLGFADLLALVSRRQELVEHDAGLVGAAVARLRRGEPEWDLDFAERLKGLRGLDDEIDLLLDAPSRATSEWSAVITRVHRSLSERGEAEGPA
jgi:hypothetical protein